MRILRAIHTLNPQVGGPIESVRQSSAALARRGHTVDVLTLDAPGGDWVSQFPVPVHAAGLGHDGYSYAPAFRKWIAEHHRKYDAVIVHGVWQYVGRGTWQALRGTSTPYFVFPHGMLDPWFKQAYPVKHLKKVLYWRWAEHRILHDARAVLFTSEEERRLAHGTFSPYQVREKVVNYGTAAPEVELGAAREEFFAAHPELRGKPLLLFLGRLHDKKGCDLLLQAWRDLPAARGEAAPLHLVIAGPAYDAEYRDKLVSLSEGLPVSFTGMLTGRVKWGALSAAEAFVLPSHQENFGIAVAEALACGTPVLISNKVNIWREIVDDGAGLAEEDTRAGTGRLLARWLEMTVEARNAMRAQARRTFENRFHIDRATDSLLAALEEGGVAR